MRINIMFGLNHVTPEMRQAEAGRLLSVVTEKLAQADFTIKEGTVIPLLDSTGKRVGVLDVFKD